MTCTQYFTNATLGFWAPKTDVVCMKHFLTGVSLPPLKIDDTAFDIIFVVVT